MDPRSKSKFLMSPRPLSKIISGWLIEDNLRVRLYNFDVDLILELLIGWLLFSSLVLQIRKKNNNAELHLCMLAILDVEHGKKKINMIAISKREQEKTLNNSCSPT
jgi:hypothetical protein